MAQAINKFCPRSGKKIEADSLAEYKGFTVGFCNPGCRDDFTEHVKERPNDTLYFDSIIKEQELIKCP
ncbi:YHS domain-containing protein [Vibrio sp. 10N.261.55.A7]|uniref:YHS domain-containing protein n=1 Tax=Vibrio sp. 10N.261.55.A7 TaxID=1880851 RepID=UPI000C81D4BA|nr:YHS domain-containing protein [Vibrio sp. 10N.261.55.A7]PMJ92660.1 YHS domain-containing protein [Vibrio sp. 10N.261.55.A7]